MIPNHSNMLIIMGKHLDAIIPGVNNVNISTRVKINICWGRKLALPTSLASKHPLEVEVQIKDLHSMVVTVTHIQFIILAYA